MLEEEFEDMIGQTEEEYMPISDDLITQKIRTSKVEAEHFNFVNAPALYPDT